MALRRQLLYGSFLLLAGTLIMLLSVSVHGQSVSIASLEAQLQNTPKDTARVNLINRLAFRLLDLNQTEKGINRAKEASFLSDSLGYDEGKARAYENIALYFSYTNQFSEAVRQYDAALSMYTELGDSASMGRVLNEVGGTFHQTSEYDTALVFFSRSLTILNTINDSLALADTYNRIGQVYLARGQNQEALENFMSALHICQSLPDYLGESKVLCRMGMVYQKLKEHKKAEGFLIKALELNQQAGPTRDIIEIYQQLGILKQENGLNQEAVQMFKKSLNLARYYNDQRTVASCLNNMGNTYHAQKNYETALGFYKRALNILNDLGISTGLVQTSNNLARAYLDMVEARKSGEFNNFSVSIVSEKEIFDLLESSLSSARKSGSFTDRVNTYDILIRASATFNLYGDAIHYQEMLIAYKDSVAGIYREQSLAQLQADFEREQTEQLIALLNSEKKVQETVMKRQRLELYFYIGGGLALVLLIIGLLNRLNFIKRTRNELEEKNFKIEEEKQRAEQSENVKEQFLSKMSHEIRVPMNTIMGSVNIIMNGKHLKAQEKYLKAINQSSENLMVIIDDILDLTKLEAGKVKLDEAPFTIRSEIRNIDHILRFRAEEKGIKFQTAVDEAVPEALVGDSTRLSQIIINLAGNGIKFTEKGKVTLHVSVAREKGEVFTLLFAVTDTGIGIPADRRDKIFQSFTQADSDTNRKYGGTGLGLTISKQLVELQSGTIGVDSQPGSGSTFWFEIPYRKAVMKPVPEKIAPTGKKMSILQGLKVLVVEDDEFNLMVLKDTLSASLKDIHVQVASTGEDALVKWEEQPFDIILMDIELPGMNGHDVTRSIRSGEKTGSDIPIIAMTANAMLNEVEACFDSGMNDYVAKPFDPDELILKINSNLINRRNP